MSQDWRYVPPTVVQEVKDRLARERPWYTPAVTFVAGLVMGIVIGVMIGAIAGIGG